MDAAELLGLSPAEFCDLLSREGISRLYLVTDDGGELRASHPLLEPLARWLARDCGDYDGHEGFFVQLSPATGVLQGAAVHRTCRGQGAGGVRFWTYDTVEAFFRDGLRLARGMTHKNALAGLWWGGGKGVMARNSGRGAEAVARRVVYEDYGGFISSLRGCYVTAEDVGTSVEDMAAVFSRTRFTTCIPEEFGGSGNPSVPTALGVVRGMEAALRHREMGTLAGRSVAIEGLGHVGTPLLGFLRERGVTRIVGADIDPARVEAVREEYSDLELDLRVVARGDHSVLASEVDIVAPCATGGVLNPETIPSIRAPIVCGAANNQLADDGRDGELLRAAGVIYMPDFLVNRMGIVNCADEQYGHPSDDPVLEAHLGEEWENSIYNLSLQVLRRADAADCSPARIALEIAEQRSRELHPLWGHRGRQIIAGLARDGWAG